jgi:hypothetical protein
MRLTMTTSTNVQTPSTHNTMWFDGAKTIGQKVEGHGLFLWNMKSHISHNGHKNISHNIMWTRPLPTVSTMKKVDPHRIQRLATNVMWHPKD